MKLGLIFVGILFSCIHLSLSAVLRATNITSLNGGDDTLILKMTDSQTGKMIKIVDENSNGLFDVDTQGVASSLTFTDHTATMTQGKLTDLVYLYDGTASLYSGKLTNLVNLYDGTASLYSGKLTNLVNLYDGTASLYSGKLMNLNSLSDGTLTITGGAISDVTDIFYSGSLTSISDERFKSEVRSISPRDALASVLNLRPIYFKWNYESPSVDYDSEYVGFIAQEVQRALPRNGSGIVREVDKSGHLGVAYERIAAILVAAVQEQDSLMKKMNAALTEMDVKLSYDGNGSVDTHLWSQKNESERIRFESRRAADEQQVQINKQVQDMRRDMKRSEENLSSIRWQMTIELAKKAEHHEALAKRVEHQQEQIRELAKQAEHHEAELAKQAEYHEAELAKQAEHHEALAEQVEQQQEQLRDIIHRLFPQK